RNDSPYADGITSAHRPGLADGEPDCLVGYLLFNDRSYRAWLPDLELGRQKARQHPDIALLELIARHHLDRRSRYPQRETDAVASGGRDHHHRRHLSQPFL